jgi:transposase
VVDQGWTLKAAAEAAGVSVRCARKWVGRWQEGDRRLLDRSSAPHRVANRTAPERVAVVVALRRLRMTAAEIAETLAMPLSTVSAVLRRSGVGKLGRIGLEPAQRYERTRPGELVHVDVKKLGRIKGGAGGRVTGPKHHYNATLTDRPGKRRKTVGYEYVHVAVDDYSRLAYAEVLLDEKASTAAGFLRRAVAFYRPPRHPSRTDPHRQRRLLPRRRPRRRLPAPRDQTPTHAPPPGPKPTGKPSASSAPCSPVGPTARSTAQAANALPPLTAGSGTTTIAGDTRTRPPTAAQQNQPAWVLHLERLDLEHSVDLAAVDELADALAGDDRRDAPARVAVPDQRVAGLPVALARGDASRVVAVRCPELVAVRMMIPLRGRTAAASLP